MTVEVSVQKADVPIIQQGARVSLQRAYVPIIKSEVRVSLQVAYVPIIVLPGAPSSGVFPQVVMVL